MNFILQPWELMLVILAGWINRRQQQWIDYLETVVAVLKEHIGKKRILLTDDQRRRLAVKGKLLGRKHLAEIGVLFTPDTILRWHRQLVANKWDYSDRKERKTWSATNPASHRRSYCEVREGESNLGLRPYQRCFIERRL